MDDEWPFCQRIAPIVGITDNQLRKLMSLTKQMVFEQSANLPLAFLFRQPQMPIDQLNRPLWGLDHGHLSPPRLLGLAS